MRRRYLVAYDVSDDRRLRRVYRTMNGYGQALQYSVFLCDLSDVERWKLKDALTRIIHHDEDRIIVVDLGPSAGRVAAAFECLGRQAPLGEPRRAVIV